MRRDQLGTIDCPDRLDILTLDACHVRIALQNGKAGAQFDKCYFGVLRAGAPPTMLWRTRVLVTRSEATVERWIGAAQTTRGSRTSGPAEDRAQPAEGRSRRTGGGFGPTTSIRSTGGAVTYRMTAETLCERADIACVTYTCTCTVMTARKWY
jgi:hypothetical protein